MIIYVAIPITGHEISEVKSRLEAIKQMLLSINRDCQVITPFDMKGWEDGQPWEWYMPRCTELLDVADHIFLSKGWEDSLGCRVEYQHALYHKKGVITEA